MYNNRLFLFSGIYCSRSLSNLRLTVPRAVRVGHSVTLQCDYDLEEAPLYSVKWYRNSDEFYRYVPKEAPPTRVFPLPGLHVDVSVSNAQKVTLLAVGRPLSGIFQCEVSADAPLFHTEIKSAPMTVAVVPDGVPTINVDKAGLERGGPLIAECFAPPASPAPNLTWYVNDQRVPGSTSSSIIRDTELLETANSRLELTGVGGSWGAIRLRCEATQFRLYRANSLVVEVKPDTPQPASVLLMGPSTNGGGWIIPSGAHLFFVLFIGAIW
ncbi:PREDICTED: uncharacterized protein LOC108564108 [Nicrophorus vespilloides]|uniref:Uncharacterized protein LOC108564108 n=1 Tax=Nicrophorus vespilloides TaxID=110193 RepID=A0ABM1MVC1_NICVS|nr:PREDICTED: uncharacterized protein LOC108564108 [Nicrophorus vespilloides]